MTQEDIVAERMGGVAWVTFDRPHTRNAFTFARHGRLVALRGQDADDGVHAVVCQGRGDETFASGTDIDRSRSLASSRWTSVSARRPARLR